MVYKHFDKKTSDGTVKNENISNKELAEELHKPFIRKFKKRTVHSSFIDNIFFVVLFFYFVLLIFIANMHGLFL